MRTARLLRRAVQRLCSARVHVATVAERHNDNKQHIIVDRVDDTAVTSAHSAPAAVSCDLGRTDNDSFNRAAPLEKDGLFAGTLELANIQAVLNDCTSVSRTWARGHRWMLIRSQQCPPATGADG